MLNFCNFKQIFLLLKELKHLIKVVGYSQAKLCIHFFIHNFWSVGHQIGFWTCLISIWGGLYFVSLIKRLWFYFKVFLVPGGATQNKKDKKGPNRCIGYTALIFHSIATISTNLDIFIASEMWSNCEKKKYALLLQSMTSHKVHLAIGLLAPLCHMPSSSSRRKERRQTN